MYLSVCLGANVAAVAVVDLWPPIDIHLHHDLFLCVCVFRDLVVCSDLKVLLESLDLPWVKTIQKPDYAAGILAALFYPSVTTEHPQHPVTWYKDGVIQSSKNEHVMFPQSPQKQIPSITLDLGSQVPSIHLTLIYLYVRELFGWKSTLPIYHCKMDAKPGKTWHLHYP